MDYELRIVVEKVAVSSQEVVQRDTMRLQGLAGQIRVRQLRDTSTWNLRWQGNISPVSGRSLSCQTDIEQVQTAQKSFTFR